MAMAKRKADPRKSKSRKRGAGSGGCKIENKDPRTEPSEAEGTPAPAPPPATRGNKVGGFGGGFDAEATASLAERITSAFLSKRSYSIGKVIDRGLLFRCGDDGTVERALWPWFLRRSAACESAGVDAKGVVSVMDESLTGEEVAFALAILSNRCCDEGELLSSADKGGGWGGGDGGDPQLGFVVDDYDYSCNKTERATVVPPTANISARQRTAAFAQLLQLLLNYLEKTWDHEEDRDDLRSIAIRTEITKFLIASYSSLDLRCKVASNFPTSSPGKATVCEGPLMDLVGLRLWDAVPRRRRNLEMKRDGLLRKRYELYDAKRKNSSGKNVVNVGFLPGMVGGLIESVAVLGGEESDGDEVIEHALSSEHRLLLRGYVSKVLELLLDLLSYPQTRTHVVPYLSSHHVAIQLALSRLYKTRGANSFMLFRQQVDMLVDSERTETVGLQAFHERSHVLQKMLHRHHRRECAEVIFAGLGRVTDGKWLRSKVEMWKEDTLYNVCFRLRLMDDESEDEAFGMTNTAKSAELLGCTRRELLTSILIYHTSSRKSDADVLSAAPLYPTEVLLWDEYSVPPRNHTLASNANSESLSLPKLNTRFLSAGDYLLRNFRLFRLESAYEIRIDIVDVIKRMRPVQKRYDFTNDSMDYYGDSQDDDGGVDCTDRSWLEKTQFAGWARMGLELGSRKHSKPGLRLIRVDPPRLGENVPSEVVAEVVLDLHHCATSLAKEWDSEVGEFDNLFLVSVDATMMTGDAAPLMGGDQERRVPDEEDSTFPKRYGIHAVRGCMVLEVRDEVGVVLSDPALDYEMAEGEGKVEPKGKLRYLRVALDPAQFAEDAANGRLGLYDDAFNLVVRRHGRENNFKAVLETIRGLMRGGADSVYRSVPSWLLPVLIGCADPNTAPNANAFASSRTAMLDYGDTFINVGHLKDSFPGCKLTVDGKEVMDDIEGTTGDGLWGRRKYQVKVTDQQHSGGGANAKVEAITYPFPSSYSGNTVRFTPVQVSAIRSGLGPGLTTIIGPPGTGKTDVAVQIIANLYLSFPTQRTVVVTHSNSALNDIFDKVMARGDVDERYMLRLGSGERNLQTTSTSSHDFTKGGRVKHILSRRGKLLEHVQHLSESLGVSSKSDCGADGAPSYTCETAKYFYNRHVKSRVDSFETHVATKKKEKGDFGHDDVIDAFPFKKYLSRLVGEELRSITIVEARKKIDEISAMFEELAEYRPMELLRSQRQRTDYLLTKQVRIVAMTCTHAAIARSRLVELGFHYDSILMEEAGQMLDIETFVPLLLQRGETDDDDCGSNNSRLRRVVLIGDDNQLPPVVKNWSFASFSRYDQSMFARLVRLGVPTIKLNKQGRSRADIARLYSWRYDSLGDLEHVSTIDAFRRANAGFAHTLQVIDVEEFEGRGESTPTAFFYQNVGEAEYAVALFQYMVLIGYPPKKISILTTYNGQKELLLDILSQRCGEGTPLAGETPGAVSTVDRYQGQQNDYVILSLVRTRAVGHLRDIRRLVVAVSRARLGLYMFCRSSLFFNCHELKRTMDQFVKRPTRLQLVKGEHYPTGRMAGEDVPEGDLHEVIDVTELGGLVHSMQHEYVANQGCH